MHTYYKNVLIFFLLLVAIAPAIGQKSITNAPGAVRIPQVYVVNSGVFETNTPYEDYVSVQRYLPDSQITKTIDTIFTQSAQDAVIAGNNLFVAAQDSIVKYHTHSQERTGAAAPGNIAAIAVKDSLLFISRQDGMNGAPSDSVFLKVFDARTLNFVANIPAVDDDAGSIAFGNQNVWVAINGGFGSTSGKIAQVNLTDFSTTIHNLGTKAKGIDRIYVREDTLTYVCPTPYGEEYGTIGRYWPKSDSLAVDSLQGNLITAAGITREYLSVVFNNAVRHYDFATQHLTDTLASGSFTGAKAYDNFLVTLSTDYATYGAMQLYDAPQSRYDSIATDISPEAVAIDKRGLELKQTAEIPDISVSISKQEPIVLSRYFADPYNTALTYQFSTSGSMANVSQSHDTLFIGYNGETNHPQKVTVTASSGSSSLSDTIYLYSPVREIPSFNDVFVVNGGLYETEAPYTDYVTVSNYYINSGEVEPFDTIYTQSAQDMALDDKQRLYVAAQDTLVVYKQESLNRMATAEVQQMKAIALTSDYLVVSRQDGAEGAPEDGSYVKILDRITLEEVADIPVSEQTAGIAIHGQNAYVAINGGWQGTEGKIAIIDLTDFSFEEVNLGANAKGIESLVYKDNNLHFVCPTPYGGSEGTIGSYSLATGNTHYKTISGQLKAHFELIEDSLLIQANNALYYYELANQELLATGVTGDFAAIAYASGEYFTTRTDYFSYGRVEVFDEQGRKVAQVPVGISPEAIAIENFSQTYIRPESTEKPKIRLQPNPATQFVNIRASARLRHAKIYSLQGRQIAQFALSGNAARLRVADMQEGIYFLQIQTSRGVTSQKLIITK